jgi:hypothetical protein
MLWNDNEEAEQGTNECKEDKDVKMDTVKINKHGDSDSDW